MLRKFLAKPTYSVTGSAVTVPRTAETVRFYLSEPVEVQRHPSAEMLTEIREVAPGTPCLGCGKTFSDALLPVGVEFSHLYMQCLCGSCAASLDDAAISCLQTERLRADLAHAKAHRASIRQAMKELIAEGVLVPLHDPDGTPALREGQQVYVHRELIARGDLIPLLGPDGTPVLRDGKPIYAPNPDRIGAATSSRPCSTD